MGLLEFFGRVLSAVALAATLIIMGVYATRIGLALPLYAWDEDTYAMRALFAPEVLAHNPFAPEPGNSAFIGLIRLIHAATPNYLPWLRAVNVAAYFAGLWLVFRVGAAGVPRRTAWIWLLTAAAFPYYRFMVSGMPDACYVGVLGVLCAITARLYRRPLAHGLAAGVVAAVLVLTKPHGLAVVAGFAAVSALDAAISRDWRLNLLRLSAFALAFFAAGSAIQIVARQTFASPLTYFLGDAYGAIVAQPLGPGAIKLGLLSFVAMASTMAMLAGVPVVIGIADIVGRWGKARQGFRLQPADLVFLLLLFAMVATLCMVALFAMKLAGTPSETHRIWGRYFEFFAPLIWLSAAGFIERWQDRASPAGRLGCASVVLAGLVGLLLSFSRHFVLFPWDATAVTAFFQHDAVRAAFTELAPYRLLAISATLLAVLAIALGARLLRVWLPYVVTLGCLSTTFEVAAMSPMIRQRQDLALDLAAAAPHAARVGGPMAALVIDAHDADMAYVGFKARPTILMWTPPNTAPEQLASFRVLVALRTEPSPAGGWRPIFRGRQVAVFTR